MEFKIVDGYEYRDFILQLFDDYTGMIVETAPDFKKYLGLQNYEKEKEDLALKYARPLGRLYIALTLDGEPAGCIALKNIDETTGEMKRLYVRPEFRRHHLGERLVDLILKDACEIGYTSVVLDTFSFSGGALVLYKEKGFVEIEKYNDNPMEDAVFLKKDISSGSGDL